VATLLNSKVGQAALLCGICCGSFVTINMATSGRHVAHPLGRDDRGYVNMANCMASRLFNCIFGWPFESLKLFIHAQNTLYKGKYGILYFWGKLKYIYNLSSSTPFNMFKFSRPLWGLTLEPLNHAQAVSPVDGRRDLRNDLAGRAASLFTAEISPPGAGYL